MSSVVMIASGKGGTGKSTVACNLGLTWQIQGEKTILIDMSPNARCLDLYLGVENFALFDIRDILTGVCSTDRGILTAPHLSGLQLIPGAQTESVQWLRKETLGSLVEVLKYRYDWIILDCPPGAGEILSTCASVSDGGIVVLTPDWPSLRAAQAAEEVMLENQVMSRGYILNRVIQDLEEKKLELDYRTVDEALRCESLGAVLEDQNIRAAGAMGIPIVAKQDTYIAENFKRIAREIRTRLYDEEW